MEGEASGETEEESSTIKQKELTQLIQDYHPEYAEEATLPDGPVPQKSNRAG